VKREIKEIQAAMFEPASAPCGAGFLADQGKTLEGVIRIFMKGYSATPYVFCRYN
jgi:hypothetical protein